MDEAGGNSILGRCLAGASPDNTTKKAPTVGGDGPKCNGMATYRFHALNANLHITDTPLGYTPSRGPSVSFELTYNHKETNQPQIFTHSNMGPRWTFEYLSFLEDDDLTYLKLHVPGGGAENYASFGGAPSAPNYMSQTVLARVSTDPVVWEARHPDGSVDVYGQPDCTVCVGRRVFLTESRDATGQPLVFTYDSSMRIVAITDATGQVTTLSYELSSDPWKVTRFTDPYGRFARFDYDQAGRLQRITDVIGLTSEFQYSSTEQESPDFITALTTPYGTTTLRQTVQIFGEVLDSGSDGPARWHGAGLVRQE